MSKLKKLRAVMAGILCAGLLLVGIGFGVGFGEFSSFTYAGHFPLDGMENQFYSEVLTLEEGANLHIAPQYISNGIMRASLVIPLRDIELATDNSIPSGQVKVDVSYRSVYSVIGINCYSTGNGTTNLDRQLNIYTTPPYTSPLAIFMTYKDRVLKDLQLRKLGDYDEILLDRVVITVNPADTDRIILD